ncbi:uncharacterized protein JN550_013557 [Neoarthrinium moseri]|uniref:uncharacterized protein n=1 Tax=Neoarthrinium moseri TaxID=1658444 RepID=UPI001FDB474D|nr:uncharacterized protein JN550_013557 [Neoarthrinium moseri]KAI1856955.1 hypothetical protein JN550_013557 [Neoarthrinium moseri]
MTGFLVPNHSKKQTMTELDVMIASIFLGITIAFAILSAGTAMRQSLHCYRRSHQATTYIFMIWGHWLANNTFALVSFLYLRDGIQASSWLWFWILVLLGIPITAHRTDHYQSTVTSGGATKSYVQVKLRWMIFTIMLAINISVFVVWIPARLHFSDKWVYINSIWDRIEKSIFLLVDASLNFYFIYLIWAQILAYDLTKYKTLYKFNIIMVGVSIGLDVALIGMKSLPNDLIYLQFQSVAYAGKLHIELNMANLIGKLVRYSNIDAPAGYLATGLRTTAKGHATTAYDARDDASASIYIRNSQGFRSHMARGASHPYRGPAAAFRGLAMERNPENDCGITDRRQLPRSNFWGWRYTSKA